MAKDVKDDPKSASFPTDGDPFDEDSKVDPNRASFITDRDTYELDWKDDPRLNHSLPKMEKDLD